MKSKQNKKMMEHKWSFKKKKKGDKRIESVSSFCFFGRIPYLPPTRIINYVQKWQVISFPKNQSNRNIPTSPPVASKEPSLLNAKANCSPTSSSWLSTCWESFSSCFWSPSSFLIFNLNKLNTESTMLITNWHFSSYTMRWLNQINHRPYCS